MTLNFHLITSRHTGDYLVRGSGTVFGLAVPCGVGSTSTYLGHSLSSALTRGEHPRHPRGRSMVTPEVKWIESVTRR
jgi:hypothetical protein